MTLIGVWGRVGFVRDTNCLTTKVLHRVAKIYVDWGSRFSVTGVSKKIKVDVVFIFFGAIPTLCWK